MAGLLMALTLATPCSLVAPVVQAQSPHTVATMPVVVLTRSAAGAGTRLAAPRVVMRPASQAPTSAPITFQTLPWPWGCIAWHESTWSTTAINPVTQDSGAFGIDYTNWDHFKTPQMPWYIPSATLAQQYQVAQAVQAAYGWGMWVTASGCGA